MRISELRCVDFRNLGLVHLTPNPRFNILEGHNGQGKTNILEAIYILGALKSFRTSQNSDLVRFGAAQAEIRGVIDAGEMERIVRVQVGRTRRVWLDGKLSRSLAASLGQLTVVLFAPEDLRITKGSPSGRRRFLDRAIFNRWPSSLVDNKRFEQALKQRNALLKSDGPDSLLDIFDEQVAEAAARIWDWRQRFLDDYVPIFRTSLDEVTGGELTGDIVYESRVDERTADGYRAALGDSRRRDRARGTTSHGPHVDDLDATLLGRSAKAFASQGQHRSFVLAMKIAEIRLLQESLGHSPVLLLDDVSSELDRGRNERLMSYLTSDAFVGQVFLTTTDREFVRIESNYSVFGVANGEIT